MTGQSITRKRYVFCTFITLSIPDIHRAGTDKKASTDYGQRYAHGNVDIASCTHRTLLSFCSACDLGLQRGGSGLGGAPRRDEQSHVNLTLKKVRPSTNAVELYPQLQDRRANSSIGAKSPGSARRIWDPREGSGIRAKNPGSTRRIRDPRVAAGICATSASVAI